jgi:uncharacterized 2Fe-2S/4Fe-4S cluster protein (DUF4445 family)
MSLLRAHHGHQTVTALGKAGASLHETLSATELSVRTGCNKNGSCGLCRVRILSGQVSPPTDQEQLNLTPALLAAGVRLSCQTFAHGEVELDVESLAPRCEWRSLPPEVMARPGREVGVGVASQDAEGLRVALDVGTTNLNLTVWGASGWRPLAALRGPNPQACFGADVIARLQAARDPAVARQLAEGVSQAVAMALRGLAPLAGPAPACQILAVGNTAMLSLLQGSHEALLNPETWDGPSQWPEATALRWSLFDGQEATVVLVPPLAGFVGSDLLAAALAAGLLEGEAPSLLVDFGTNTEIALWDGSTLWVTSAAGGPAFEACGFSCGVPGEAGAIARVRPGAPFGFEVLGGGTPKGVCATGMVDWIACLVGNGLLNRRGAFTSMGGQDAPFLGAPEQGLTLTKRDIDLFQRAKAAIGAGIRILLRHAGVRGGDLRRVVSTGLFGRGLDSANAQALGLLPTVARARIEAYGNLALAGCEEMLRSAEGPRAVEPLRARARLINLARCDDFEDLFLQGLFLEPLEDL